MSDRCPDPNCPIPLDWPHPTPEEAERRHAWATAYVWPRLVDAPGWALEKRGKA